MFKCSKDLDLTMVSQELTGQESRVLEKVFQGTTYATLHKETEIPKPSIRRICRQLQTKGLVEIKDGGVYRKLGVIAQ